MSAGRFVLSVMAVAGAAVFALLLFGVLEVPIS